MATNGTARRRTKQVDLEEQLNVARMEAGQYANSLEVLTERLAELELSIEDSGWIRQGALYEREFSPLGLRRLRRLSRLSYLKNPLINHAVRVQAHYVWAQGVAVSASNAVVNDLVQAWLDDRKNSLELTGHSGRTATEIELQVEGEVFIALFTNISTGWVRVRKIHPDEIDDIVYNPEDARESWFYRRVWGLREFDPFQGVFPTKEQVTYHPDWRYDPNSPGAPGRPETINQAPVIWDAPIYHVKVGGFSDMSRGVPEHYSALDWARAVKDDLEAYATVKRALARFAWNLQVKGGKGGVAAAKSRVSTTLASDGGSAMDTNPPAVTGATFIGSEGASLSPIRTAGSAPSPDEGQRLWLMVSSGTGLPETILTGNADVGNYATARSLDRPTELKMRDRQTLWADVYQDLFSYVIEQAVIRPNGPLAGKVIIDPVSQQRTLKTPLGDDGEPQNYGVDIRFPSILERDSSSRVAAIVQAATLNAPGIPAGTLDDKTVTKLLLDALGVTEIDELLNQLYPGNEIIGQARQGTPPPPPAPGGSATAPQETALVAALREFREAVQPLIRHMQLVPPDA